jgi:arylsulfatase A-like enzyme
MTRTMQCLVAACLVLLLGTTAVARQPNVIIIVADDLGYADVGCYGQDTGVKTPNIDALAAGGIRFTSAYVSCPVCSPTRAGLLTGRYQQRFGFEQNPKGPKEEAMFGLPAEEVTLPQVLKEAGYATGMVGKWHLGTNVPKTHPQERGFDEFFGFRGGAHRYVRNEEPEPDSGNAIQRNGKAVGEKAYLTDAFSREAVSFIERHKDKPFFLYLAYNAPHSPMQAPPKYLNRFPDETDPQRKAFLAMLSALDDGVGRVMTALREHGVENDTLVVFHSDNGGPTYGNSSRNDPLRGAKGGTLEGGIRVPFVMQWKGRLPAGKVEDRAVIQLDLFPTALAAAGVTAPSGRTIDGKDLLPYLTGKNDGPVHDTLYWRFGPRRAIRHGDWKLHWNGEEIPRLYDVAKDPAESRDLAASDADRVEQLLARYREWDAQLARPRWPGRLEGNGGDVEPKPKP